MSVQAISWAYEQQTGSTLMKFVLVTLANYANADLQSWPSLQTIAAQTEASRRGVIKAINQLCEAGFIAKSHRGGNGAGRKTNVYELLIHKEKTGLSAPVSPGGLSATGSLPECTRCTSGGELSSPDPKVEPSEEPLSPLNRGEGDQNPAPAVSDTLPNCPHEKLIELYHKHLPQNPRIRTWKGQRPATLRARWREHPDLEWWDGFLAYCGESKFLTGRVNGSKDRPPFLASFEWLLKPSNFQRINEGQFHRV